MQDFLFTRFSRTNVSTAVPACIIAFAYKVALWQTLPLFSIGCLIVFGIRRYDLQSDHEYHFQLFYIPLQEKPPIVKNKKEYLRIFFNFKTENFFFLAYTDCIKNVGSILLMPLQTKIILIFVNLSAYIPSRGSVA
jgi:hypothetical protein